MNQAVKAESLSYTYPGLEEGQGVKVFENLDLEIEQGSFVAILGTNGSGKSTLAKHFNAILLPSGGRAYVYGMDTSDENLLIKIRRSVGMVFQNPDNQIVANVVEEDVAFAPENLGISSPMIRHRVDNALKQVGMYEYRTHAPHLLSGGQKQRIAIAGVIAMEPRCIVLDEPTAMLDPKGRREVMETVTALNREKGITVILITHHMDEAARADRMIIIHRGEIRADGTPAEIFADVEKIHSLGLAAPETVELCHELNKEGFCLPLNLLDTAGCAQALYDALKV